jgi:hypothetical protein
VFVAAGDDSLERAGLRVEDHVVHVSQIAAQVAEHTAVKQLEIASDRRFFAIVSGLMQRPFVGDHDRVRTEGADALPLDQASLAPLPHYHRDDPSMLSVNHQAGHVSDLFSTDAAYDLPAIRCREPVAHLVPRLARKSSTADSSPTRS